MVKNLPAYARDLREVQGFDPQIGKIPLEEGMATHSNILACRISWTEKPWGHKELAMTERLSTYLKRLMEKF